MVDRAKRGSYTRGMRSRVFACLGVASAFVALSALSPNAPRAHAAPSVSSASPLVSPLVAMTAVPPLLQRRAETFLAEQSGPGRAWSDARGLADTAIPVHDAFSSEPAYYAFGVVGRDGRAMGYMLLAVDERDFPVVEAPEGGDDLATQLEAARSRPGVITRVVRVGVRSYVAEGAAREEVARIGHLPFKVDGVTPDILRLTEKDTEGHAYAGGGKVETSLPRMGTPLHWGGFATYAEYRNEAGAQEAIASEITRRNARAAWRDERALGESALVVEPYQTYGFRLLGGRGDFEHEVHGTSVFTFVERDADGHTTLRVVGKPNGRAGDETRVRVQYADGAVEHFRFVPPPDTKNLLGLAPPASPPLRLPPKPVPLPPNVRFNPVTLPTGPKVAASVTLVPTTPPTSIVTRVRPTGTRVNQLDRLPLDGVTPCATGTGRLRTAMNTYVGALHPTHFPSGTDEIVAKVPYELASSITIRPLAQASIRGTREMVFTLSAQGASGMTSLSAQRDPAGNTVLRMVTGTDLNPTIQWIIGAARDGRFYFYSLFTRSFLVPYDDGTLGLTETMPFEDATEENAALGFLPMCTTTPGEVWIHRGGPNGAFNDVRKYDQIRQGRAPNDSPCMSGCGATAWAMLFGWADLRASVGDTEWGTSGGLFRSGASRTGNPAAVAPELFWPSRTNGHDRNAEPFDSDAANMIWEIRSYMNDVGAAGCASNGERWTAPHIMAQAHQYFAGRAGVSLTADYDGAGIMTTGGRELAKSIISRHRPAILGMGALIGSGHYPLGVAWGSSTYRLWNPVSGASTASHDYFVTYMGFGEIHFGVIPAGTWFQGALHPTTDKGS